MHVSMRACLSVSASGSMGFQFQRWCWARAVGGAGAAVVSSPLERLQLQDGDDEHAHHADGQFQRVALVVGSTGIVGASLLDILPRRDTPGGPWKVYALSRRPPPPWSLSSPSSSVTHVHVDLTAAAAALAPLTDVTHVFYAAWSPRATEPDNRRANAAMLRNVLSAVAAAARCPALAHVSLQTGIKHYLGPFDAFHCGGGGAPDPPYTEDAPRRRDYPDNFYYDLEDTLFAELSSPRPRHLPAVTWSVHRPTVVFGFSPRSALNIVCSLCEYAAVRRNEGEAVLRWPGSRYAWESFATASDADLVAEQHLWAAVDPAAAANHAFNCSNGDLYCWRMLWPVLAGRFGMGWAGYGGEEARFKVADAMAGKEAVWAEVVRENGLVETRLGDVANWWLVDVAFHDDGGGGKLLDSMNKSKEHGFLGFRNTVKSFDTWIARIKAAKIVP